MALIKCSECGRDVSSKAASCPHCGAPVELQPPVAPQPPIVVLKTADKKKRHPIKRFFTWCIIIFAVVFVLPSCGMVIYSILTSSSGISPSATGSKSDKYLAVQTKFDALIDERYDQLLEAQKSNDFVSAHRILEQFEYFNRFDYKSIASIKREIRISEAIFTIKNTADNDLKIRAETYAELSDLVPDNMEYKEFAAKYSEAWNKELAVRAELAKAERIKQSRINAENARIAARTQKIQEQFSNWDGSHYPSVKMIKSSMNDPDSYDHVKTVYWDQDDSIVVQTTFRGKNAFGGVVINWIKAKFSLDGRLIAVLEQGP